MQTAGAAPDVRIHFPVLDQDDTYIYIYIKHAKKKKVLTPPRSSMPVVNSSRLCSLSSKMQSPRELAAFWKF